MSATDERHERTGLWLWGVSPALFTPYMNSTLLSESNISSSEDVQLSTFSCISCSVFLFCSLCHIFCVSILYVGVLFISEHVATVQLCLHISHKHIHTLLRDTMDKSHVRLLWHSLYWVNGTLFVKISVEWKCEQQGREMCVECVSGKRR
jgi:hypothetical protein